MYWAGMGGEVEGTPCSWCPCWGIIHEIVLRGTKRGVVIGSENDPITTPRMVFWGGGLESCPIFIGLSLHSKRTRNVRLGSCAHNSTAILLLLCLLFLHGNDCGAHSVCPTSVLTTRATPLQSSLRQPNQPVCIKLHDVLGRDGRGGRGHTLLLVSVLGDNS